MPRKKRTEEIIKAKRKGKTPMAAGLSNGLRAGVNSEPPAANETSEKTHYGVEYSYELGQLKSREHLSAKRSPAVVKEIKRENRRRNASKQALFRQAQRRAHKRFFKE